MSTSVQAYLLNAENVFFMGIGPSRTVRPDVLLAFQRMIVRTPSQFYDADYVAPLFKEGIRQAHEKSAEFFVLSDETIPFPLGYARADTSYVERMIRLKAVMPGDTTVLMIVRRPEDYLKSTFKHRSVMNGASFSYEEYIKRLLLLGDTNLLGTIKYFHFAEAARQIFGSVKVVAMEAIEDDENEFLRLVNAQVSSVPAHGRLPRENSGMPDGKFAGFRDLYAAFGDTLSDDDFNVLSPADRLIAKNNISYFGSVLAGALAKEQVLGAVRNLALGLPDRPAKPCFALSDEARKLLADYVSESNAMLKAHYGVDTDDYSYDLF
jgi:hypothetical protein